MRDCDVGTASRGLLSGSNLEDTVYVNLKDNLENSITSFHGGNWCEGELSEGGVVLAVDTLALENGELDSLSAEKLAIVWKEIGNHLLIIRNSRKGSINDVS